MQHVPVMTKEVLTFLDPQPGETIVDATLGCGGHGRAILERVRPSGKLIGIDRDAAALACARECLGDVRDSLFTANENFKDIGAVLASFGVASVDGILFDLGVSSLQLDTPERGFSIKHEAPLDMRMDTRSGASARDLVNNLSQEELERILFEYGEERFRGRIARAIVESRHRRPIATTGELADIVIKAQPYHRFQKIHPATRTFQALRIAVNNELPSLECALGEAVRFLASGAKICVLTYHSLEDRIIKCVFKDLERQGLVKRILKKPLRPCQEEMARNPRARSAKLRVAEKI
ncbi:MAG: 16S rRNA (cytosine(1402)-N(4))-methyltransferase RsmH [Candidatus Omnitrophota bacterium]